MSDDDLRARLRDLGPRPDEINPAAVDPFALDVVARRRRSHRRAAGVAVLAVVAAAVAVPVAVMGPSAPARVSAVAGPQHGPAATTSTLTPTSPTGTATPAVDSCPLSHLQVEPGHSGGGLGHANLTITFTNASPYACQLAGYPEVFGVTTTGTKTELAHDTTLPPPVGTAVVLQPGTMVEAMMFGLDNPQNGQRTCPAPYASFLVQLPYQSATTTISAYVPFLAADFPSCVPALISAFGPPGSFGGLDGVPTTVQGCSPSQLRLGVPPGTPLLTHYDSGKVQVNLSVTNIGPACTAFGYPSLTLYGSSGGSLNLPVADGDTDQGNLPPGDVWLQSSQSANFVLEFTPTGPPGKCAHVSALRLDGTTSRLTLDGKTGGSNVCGTVHESAIYPPAY